MTGTNVLYDIVCSVVIGGIVLVMIIGFNSNIVQSATSQQIKYIAQTNLTTVTNILEYEFSKMGYRVFARSDSAIMYADSNKISFIGDFSDAGKIDTVVYSYDPVTASGQLNNKTHVLKRTYIPQGSSPSTQAINLGITRFRIYYYNVHDTALVTNPVPQTSQIKSLKVAMNIESTVNYKETTMPYLKLNPGVYWERLIKPKNLR